MNRIASDFGQAVEMDKKTEEATREMLDASIKLALEIAKKENPSEAEKRFVIASTMFHVLALVQSPHFPKVDSGT